VRGSHVHDEGESRYTTTIRWELALRRIKREKLG